MTSLRFTYQQMRVRETDGKVLNVGCNTDPANLKLIFPDRVTNADLFDYDAYLEERLPVDLTFDVRWDWPIEDDTYETVILGDILEHLPYESVIHVLGEAWRVARRVIITVPSDPRLGPGWNDDGTRKPEAERNDAPGSFHVIHIQEADLRTWLDETGWRVVDWRTVPYQLCDEGYFVEAARK